MAAAITGTLGIVQVGGRAALTAAHRVPAAAVTALMLAAQAAGAVLLLLIKGPASVAVFEVLFGLGYGVLSVARPDPARELRPRHLYARLSGIQALLVIAGEAAGPTTTTTAAALHTATRSYTPVFIAVAACSASSALLLTAAEHARTCPQRTHGPS